MFDIQYKQDIGIGQLKLGMTSDELENALLQMKKQWSNSSDEAMQMECCAETDDPNLITGRYMDNDLFFLVQYRNGKATEIGIQRDLSKVASIKLFGMDMFNTTAECIIAPYPSSGIGCNYTPPRGWCIAFSEGSSPEGCDFPQSWSAPNHTGDATLPLRWLPPATLLWTCHLGTSCVASCSQPTSFIKYAIFLIGSEV